MELRTYQKEAVIAAWKTFKFKGLIVLPTGAGKSVVLSKIIDGIIYDDPDATTLVVSHNKEILKQDFAEFKLFSKSNGDKAGLFGASLGDKDLSSQVIFGQIQSLNNVSAINKFTNIIVDEAHLIPVADDSSYRKLFGQNSGAKILGLTATPYRLDSGLLTDPDFGLFENIIYEATVQRLVDEGYLAPIVYCRGEGGLTTKGLKKTGGEYQGKAQGEQLSKKMKNILADLLLKTKSSKKVLIFCPNIEMIEKFEPAIPDCKSIIGSTADEDRDSRIADFANNKYKYLINCGCLTTGFNVPDCDTIILLRATASASLYVQMVGRGMRIAPGKDNCLVLDYGNNVERFGEVTNMKIDGAKISMKCCAECGSFSKRGTKECKCGSRRFLKKCRYCEEYSQPEVTECSICEKSFAMYKECDACGEMVGVKKLRCPACQAFFPLKNIVAKSYNGFGKGIRELKPFEGEKLISLFDVKVDDASRKAIMDADIAAGDADFALFDSLTGGYNIPKSVKINLFVVDENDAWPSRVPVYLAPTSEKPFARKSCFNVLHKLGLDKRFDSLTLKQVVTFIDGMDKANLPELVKVEKNGRFYSVKGFQRL